jgi:phytanoyl-CoA hydroxylase
MEVQEQLLSDGERAAFAGDGYVVKRQLFAGDELASIATHYRRLRERDVARSDRSSDLPGVAWPRVMFPHRSDRLSLDLLLDRRTMGAAEELLGGPVLAVQSMWYWKAPGTRGQALHQDEYYVRTESADCLAAWVSLDDADSENGCLRIVPGSHRSDLQCPHGADPELSFSRHEVDVPSGMQAQEITMSAGDVLYFHGRTIHGSMPNRTQGRFRRTFICHFVPESATALARGYQPVHDAEGHELWLDESGPETDPCGGGEFPL